MGAIVLFCFAVGVRRALEQSRALRDVMRLQLAIRSPAPSVYCVDVADVNVEEDTRPFQLGRAL